MCEASRPAEPGQVAAPVATLLPHDSDVRLFPSTDHPALLSFYVLLFVQALCLSSAFDYAFAAKPASSTCSPTCLPVRAFPHILAQSEARFLVHIRRACCAWLQPWRCTPLGARNYRPVIPSFGSASLINPFHPVLFHPFSNFEQSRVHVKTIVAKQNPGRLEHDVF